MRDTYSSAEVAEKIGIGLDAFLRDRARMHVEDKLPRPVRSRRPYRFHKLSIDAWLGRYHPLAITHAPANDTAPPLADDVEAWRAALYTDLGATR